MIKHFIFYVSQLDNVIGYDIYNPNKNIVNHDIDEGYYLCFYEEKASDFELIQFLYNNTVLYIRKKTAFELRV